MLIFFFFLFFRCWFAVVFVPRNTIGSSADISHSRVYSICACGVFFPLFFFFFTNNLIIIITVVIVRMVCWISLNFCIFPIVFSVEKIASLVLRFSLEILFTFCVCWSKEKQALFGLLTFISCSYYYLVVVIFYIYIYFSSAACNSVCGIFIVYVIYSSICMFVCRQFYNSIILLSHNSETRRNTPFNT